MVLRWPRFGHMFRNYPRISDSGMIQPACFFTLFVVVFGSLDPYGDWHRDQIKQHGLVQHCTSMWEQRNKKV